MNRIRTLGRAVVVLVVGLIYGGVAWAQPMQPQPQQESQGDVSALTMAYFIVAVCVTLGVMVVVISNHRREREKPEEYQEKNLVPTRD